MGPAVDPESESIAPFDGFELKNMRVAIVAVENNVSAAQSTAAGWGAVVDNHIEDISCFTFFEACREYR
ncbi:hypothetical protein [Roseobacter sp. MH60115]|uniref:hypothetical protein n=1 Tax=Roseobacter sp. MH60115 TaxID=2785324 RepID=UPI001E65A6F4|nr:hypothetical protein [Roseobacter sp. MH60115]